MTNDLPAVLQQYKNEPEELCFVLINTGLQVMRNAPALYGTAKNSNKTLSGYDLISNLTADDNSAYVRELMERFIEHKLSSYSGDMAQHPTDVTQKIDAVFAELEAETTTIKAVEALQASEQRMKKLLQSGRKPAQIAKAFAKAKIGLTAKMVTEFINSLNSKLF